MLLPIQCPTEALPNCAQFLTVLCAVQIGQRLVRGKEYDTYLILSSLSQGSMRLFLKLIPLSNSALSGVPCHHGTCFSRPKMVFSHPVVDSTAVST